MSERKMRVAKEIVKVQTVNDYVRYVGAEELHQHVGVVHYDELRHCRQGKFYNEACCLFLFDMPLEGFSYGTSPLNMAKGSLLCVAPGQVFGSDGTVEADLKGYALLFDHEALRGSPLLPQMSKYTYFSYDFNEALVLSDEQRQTLEEIMERIRTELRYDDDKEKVSLIVVVWIMLMLEYVHRYYFENTVTASPNATDLLQRFESLLKAYYDKDRQNEGLPSVKYFAQELCLTPNYLGDFVRQQTGKTAVSIIMDYCFQQAYQMLASGKSVKETSESLGFEHPQHFSRAFKNHFGLAPSQVVNANP